MPKNISGNVTQITGTAKCLQNQFLRVSNGPKFSQKKKEESFIEIICEIHKKHMYIKGKLFFASFYQVIKDAQRLKVRTLH